MSNWSTASALGALCLSPSNYFGANYKCMLNRVLPQSAYPVPIVQNLLQSLGQGTVLAQAYQQLPVNETTAEAQTIVTHRGTFNATGSNLESALPLAYSKILWSCYFRAYQASSFISTTSWYPPTPMPTCYLASAPYFTGSRALV